MWPATTPGRSHELQESSLPVTVLEERSGSRGGEPGAAVAMRGVEMMACSAQGRNKLPLESEAMEKSSSEPPVACG